MEKQYKIYNQDCVEALKELEDNSVDSIITDPPYGLGFMGKEWDSLPPSREVFEECFRVLKHGGHILSFGGTRTYHRMAVAIEDAGFEVRDMIEWVYGSGFPKSHNIGKAVDKLQGNGRVVVGKNPMMHSWKAEDNTGQTYGKYGKSFEEVSQLTKGTSEWEGWGTALKPAHEPICMARKPLAEKTVAQNVLKYGTGGINIDESRVEGISEVDKNSWKTNRKTDGGSGWAFRGETSPEQNIQGRFPANLIHDNSEEVRECFPETKSGKMGPQHTRHTDGSPNGIYGKFDINHELGETYGDSGNASRFFKSIIYQAKASKSERGQGNNHPTVKPIALMEYLIKMVTPKGGVVLDPFNGSGSTGCGAVKNGFKYIGIDITPEYIEISECRIKAHIPAKDLFSEL